VSGSSATLGSYDVAVSIEPPGGAAGSNAAATWLDDAPVQAGWAPPAGSAPSAELPGRRIPAAVVYGTVALSLVLIATAVWGLGGLKLRTDVFRDVPVGSMISTGPYELSFTEVTAQRKVGFDQTRYWEVTAVGSGRTTGVSSIAPVWDGEYGMFVAKDAASREVQLPSGAKLGGPAASSDRRGFTPGLGAIPYAVTFKFSEGYRPGATLRFVVYDLDFYDNSILKDGEKAWHNAAYGSRLLLPVRVLPDAPS